MFEQSQITQIQATLLGAKKFKGEIDGNKLDTCTVLVATPMPSQSGNAVGFTAANMKFGESHNFKRLENLKFPHCRDCNHRNDINRQRHGGRSA